MFLFYQGHTHEGSYNGDLGDLYSFIVGLLDYHIQISKDNNSNNNSFFYCRSVWKRKHARWKKIFSWSIRGTHMTVSMLPFFTLAIKWLLRWNWSFLFGFLGNGLSDVTTPHGRISQPILTHIPYDLLTVGNVLVF